MNIDFPPPSNGVYNNAGSSRQLANYCEHEDLQRMAGYQVRKYNACRRCLKCESLCAHGAITINTEGYHINPDKCKRCKMCVTAKYLDGGCLMDKFLKTVKESS